MFESKIGRRRAIRNIALLVGVATSAEALVGCSYEQDGLKAKEKLRGFITNLPDTSVKRALISDAMPYFQVPAPTSIVLEGIPFIVHDVSIAAKHIPPLNAAQPYIQGTESLFNEKTARKNPRNTLRPELIRVPYVGLTRDDERKGLPANLTTKDGIPLISRIFEPKIPVYAGISPSITVSTPHPKELTIEAWKFAKAWEEFTYVKEACGLLLENIWIKEVIKKMKENNLPIMRPTKDSNNVVEDTEFLTMWIREIGNEGRFGAAFDIAGYILAVKAFEKRKDILGEVGDTNLKDVVSELVGINLGETPEAILYKSLDITLTNPKAEKFVHIGALSAFP